MRAEPPKFLSAIPSLRRSQRSAIGGELRLGPWPEYANSRSHGLGGDRDVAWFGICAAV